jgi:23S rRNA (adenine1618-N6)-methyltransferase
MPKPNQPSRKAGLHPRNRHIGGYDFGALAAASPELRPFVRPNPAGSPSIDFSDPKAVLALNRALLKHHYGIATWDISAGYLCPPIPSRADYVHVVADLLQGTAAEPLRGSAIAILDIGTGANCIYPILGVAEYGWRFVATDIDAEAVRWARHLIETNPTLRDSIECREQRHRSRIFEGVVAPDERFAACMCNPPFHASATEAAAGTRRKIRNLTGRTANDPMLNFGGRAAELWCNGGEVGFVRQMIAESAARPGLCRWFTSLVSKRDSLPSIQAALRAARAAEVRTVDLAQGQKRTRIVAWRFTHGPDASGGPEHLAPETSGL